MLSGWSALRRTTGTGFDGDLDGVSTAALGATCFPQPLPRPTLGRVGERPALFLGLLADQPGLVAEVGALRWRASGAHGTPGPWIEATARDAGRDGLPVTLVAMDLDGQAIGAVTLGRQDTAAGDVCASLAPWVVRMVVRTGERRCGVGRLMVTALEDLAREHGHDRMWVVAEGEDAAFYRGCGWLPTEDLADPRVLCKVVA
jgi:GNAT superfamily N-acetyltransferase